MKRFNVLFVTGLVFLALAGFLLYKFWVITLNIVGGFLIYSLVSQCAAVLERKEIKGIRAKAAIGLFFLALAVAGALFIVLPFVEQVQTFAGQFPVLFEQFKEKIAELGSSAPFVTQLYESLRERLLKSFSGLFELSGPIITSMVTIPIIAVILLESGKKIKQKVFEAIPNDYFEVSVTIVHDSIGQVQNFLVAKSLESLALTIIYAVGFWVIGLPQPLVFGLVGGVLNIVPYLGPLLTLVPVGLAAVLSGGWSLFGLALIVLLFARLLDDAFLQTWLVSRFVAIHPLVVVLVTLIAGEVLGPIGLVVGIPVFVVAKILVMGMYTYLRALERHELYLAQEKGKQQNDANQKHHQVKADVF